MTVARSMIRALRADARGSMAIETALVAPILALLSIGGFEVSSMVARQSELQSAAAEAEAIALAAPPDDATERNTVKQVIMTSTGLAAANVTLTQRFRCGTETALVSDDATCADPGQVSEYLEIVLTDTYTPYWTEFGVGDSLDYNITRLVMVP